MNTIKLSLNALVALSCLLLFMTSCQDDAVENNLLPTQEADASQTPVPDDVLQLLHSVAESSPLGANLGARTARPFVFEYNFALTVSELVDSRPGEVLEEFNGTLTLWAVDSSDLINSPSAQIYQGGYVAVNAQGDTIRRRAAAVVGEGSQEATLLIKNIPGAGDLVSPFDFRITDDSFGSNIGRGVVFEFESDFIEHDDQPENPVVTVGDSVVAFEVSLSVFEVERGLRGNQLTTLTGTLTLSIVDGPFPDENLPVTINGGEEPFGDFFYEGSYELTDEQGTSFSIPAVVDASIDEDLFDFLWTGVIPETQGGFIQFQAGFLPEGFETTNPNGGILIAKPGEGSDNDFFVVVDAEPVAPAM